METIKYTNAATGEVTERIVNESLVVGQRFRLAGRSTVFVATKVADSKFGAMVFGDSECGGYCAGARVCDTVSA